ncbi:MAG: hypothetical protein NTY68_00575 [Candidatus Micrarchaeota archaeon]|nr:hypothetical protein [Candidatus Micrarchaeota archaeon]
MQGNRDFTNIWHENANNYPTLKAFAGTMTSGISNTATIFNSPVRISEVTFSKNPITEGEAVIVGINLTDLECDGGDCQVSISVQKPGQSNWEALRSNLITWIDEIGRWVATISTQIGQGWVGLVSVQVNVTDECKFCSTHGYGYGYGYDGSVCGQCTCQDYATHGYGYGYGYDSACGDSKTYQFTVSKSSPSIIPTPNPPSVIPEENLPLNIMVDSISCQSDGTGDVTVKAWDYKDRPLQGVLVSLSGQSKTTGADGMATFIGLGKGDYSLTSSLAGYETTIVGFSVSCQKNVIPTPPNPQPPAGEAMGNLSIILLETDYNADGTANVKFLVRDYYNHSVSGAAVTISGRDIIYYTDDNGTVAINRLMNGEYTATVSKNGYSSDKASFTIKFEIKKEPAGQPTQNPISEAANIIYTLPWCPILIILAILILLFALWRRKKKKEKEQQVDEQSIKPEPEGPKPQDPAK